MEKDSDLIRQAASAMHAGAAVCLVGAGFSRATPAGSSHVPSTPELTEELRDLFEIPSCEEISLSEVAEYAQEQPNGKAKLTSHLIQRLTATSPKETQKWIISQNWRSIFTTNFDDVIENCGMGSRTIVTPATQVRSISPDRTPIIYLHGRALDVREADIDPKIVISETNYLNLEKENQDLYAKLFNEIQCARWIFIIGYSLRDLQIASGFLKSGRETREKTIIVTGPNDSEFTIGRLRKFGHVMSIGLEGLVNELRKYPDHDERIDFQFIRESDPIQEVDKNEAEDFVALLLRGSLEGGRYLRQKITDNEPYCIERTQLRIIEEATVNRFMISSDFGNGKTGFLQQLSVNLSRKGTRVFWIETRLPELFEEIEEALRLRVPVAFLIDDVLRYREVAIFIGERLHGQALLVATTRGDQDSRFEEIATRLGGAYRSVDLNMLDEEEIFFWDKLLERWGYWESKSGLDSDKRREFLRVQCGSELRSIILALFKESKIAATIDQIVQFFVRHNERNRRAFAGLLISSLCQRHVSWSSLVNWLDFDEDALREDIRSSEVAFLFQRGRSWNLFTSAQLADFILRTRFVEEDKDIIVEVYSRIVLKTADGANDHRSGWDASENLKELMKFRFLTRLFGDNDSATRLIGQVYRKLSQAPRIRNNPQFWLQYAMSRIEVDDLGTAERYINTALSKADSKGVDYSPFQILGGVSPSHP